jgi:hypothetical protein
VAVATDEPEVVANRTEVTTDGLFLSENEEIGQTCTRDPLKNDEKKAGIANRLVVCDAHRRLSKKPEMGYTHYRSKLWKSHKQDMSGKPQPMKFGLF